MGFGLFGRGRGVEAGTPDPRQEDDGFNPHDFFSDSGGQRLPKNEQPTDWRRPQEGRTEALRERREGNRPSENNGKMAEVVPLRERQKADSVVADQLAGLQLNMINPQTEYRFTLAGGKDNQGEPYLTNQEYWQKLRVGLEAADPTGFAIAVRTIEQIEGLIDSGRKQEIGPLLNTLEAEVNEIVVL